MWMNIIFLMHLWLVMRDCYGKQQPIINTPSGKIAGITQHIQGKTVHSFLGIPYAKPPLGQLRFKKPVAIEPWGGVLKATKMGPGCIQCAKMKYPGVDPGPDLSEDCLYLNIWVPANTDSPGNKSVIFFIPGGGFKEGSSRINILHGIALAGLGDVIVTTMNYRLGPQGFIYSETDAAPGNMGLYDMLEAMKWVRNNIESFGGKKDDLTIWGQSVGAISISIFMTSPLWKGLFKRVILDSGSAITIDRENNTLIYNLSENLVRDVGCLNHGESLKNVSESAIQCLRGVNGMELCKTYSTISQNVTYGLYPRTGDEMVPDKSRKLYKLGDFEAYDMLTGTNRDEGSTRIAESFPDVFGYFGQKYPAINVTFGKHIVESHFKPFSEFLSPKGIADYYFEGITDNDSLTKIFRQAQKAIGDFERICPSVFLAEINARKGKQTYYYKFNHYSSNSPFAPYMGVVHYLELPYTFGFPFRYPQNYTNREEDLSRFMIDTWSGFAKNGRPPLQTWPLYSRSSHLLVDLNANRPLEVIVGRHLQNCDMFRPIFGF